MYSKKTEIPLVFESSYLSKRCDREKSNHSGRCSFYADRLPVNLIRLSIFGSTVVKYGKWPPPPPGGSVTDILSSSQTILLTPVGIDAYCDWFGHLGIGCRTSIDRSIRFSSVLGRDPADEFGHNSHAGCLDSLDCTDLSVCLVCTCAFCPISEWSEMWFARSLGLETYSLVYRLTSLSHTYTCLANTANLHAQEIFYNTRTEVTHLRNLLGSNWTKATKSPEWLYRKVCSSNSSPPPVHLTVLNT